MRKIVQIGIMSLGLFSLPIATIADVSVSVPSSIKIQFPNPAASNGDGVEIVLPDTVRSVDAQHNFQVDPKNVNDTYHQGDIFNLTGCFLTPNPNARLFICQYSSGSQNINLRATVPNSPEFTSENLLSKGWELIQSGEWFRCTGTQTLGGGCQV